ncbi:E3 ubiquitin-protein ligase makorin-2-like isoform X1 [Erpetoichthys calabaricus]|uniref:E3 ubiquitin-protein ligase makorin-2-like isoform X2 n=1 Tax=Erpetoichthys calabaricus TaxID=27687 RepID=UPI0022348D5B|nr:E3 ubiquitin-protein ligase makorin-2-like isoform X2 [Erpetoichthys calabaricus]XP_051777463.1 E3 ubiquitin-protein ligase makorin-2-like isoform X1 [Erpetoichthys calabaricus]
MSTKNVTCRYFLHGVCREGSRCLFSHDVTASKPSTICKFYQRGQCAYGSRCRYDHVKPPIGKAAAEHTVRNVEAIAAPQTMYSDSSALGITAALGRPDKKPLVLRDRALCSLSDERIPPYSDSLCWSSEEESLNSRPLSYLEAIQAGLENSASSSNLGDTPQLCPYAAAGQCYSRESCGYVHGEVCDICGLEVLHPADPEQRREHEKMCMMAFEQDMEQAFAVQTSQNKVCSICMEVVYQKSSSSERRFGILSSCCHTYCLSCIRQWRCAKQFENKIIKSCPECRVVSEFVIPSAYWVEDQNEKNKLIEEFKTGVGRKACKYFDQGKGTCPFGGKCLYLHAYPDGRRAEPEKPRKQLSSEGSVRFLNSVRLWDFIEEREHRGLPQYDDQVEELGELFMELQGPADEDGVVASH